MMKSAAGGWAESIACAHSSVGRCRKSQAQLCHACPWIGGCGWR